MDVKDVLINEFIEEVEKLKDMEVGSDQHKTTLDGVTKLADRLIEIEKFETECEEKTKQKEDDKRDRYIKYGISIGTTLLSTTVYCFAFIASTNFERFGSFTTKGGQGSLRELLTLKTKS